MKTTPTQSSDSPPAEGGLTGRIADFFASRASLSLITLLIFLGLSLALVPVAWTYAHLSRSTQVPAGASATRGAGTVPTASGCPRILVSFASGASLGQVAALLERLNASVFFGPDENGAFELSVKGAPADAIIAALNRAEGLVVTASALGNCQ